MRVIFPPRLARLVLVAAAVAVALGFAYAGVAMANNVGGNYIDTGWGTLTGTRSQIQSPGFNIVANNGNLALMRVSLEYGYFSNCSPSCGLIQPGR